MPARGVVLAGGRGERLGLGMPKALARIGERTLVQRAISTLAECCDEVFVVAPAGLDLGDLGTYARRIDDVAGFAGPLAGLVAGIEACGGHDAVALGVDFPLVTAGWPRLLLARLAAAHVHAVVPRPGGIAQPLVAAFAGASASRLRAALERGVTSLRGPLESMAVSWLDDAELDAFPGGRATLLNVNTPADLELARHTLRDSVERAR